MKSVFDECYRGGWAAALQTNGNAMDWIAMATWVQERIGPAGINEQWDRRKDVFYFKNEADAMFFKLAWANYIE